jgi:predicted transglutaminase-like protease
MWIISRYKKNTIQNQRYELLKQSTKFQVIFRPYFKVKIAEKTVNKIDRNFKNQQHFKNQQDTGIKLQLKLSEAN